MSMPELRLPDEPQFMIANGKTYLLEEVRESPTDFLANVRTYYEESCKTAREQLVNYINTESQTDLNAQIDRIQKHNSRAVITVPENMRAKGTIMMFSDNKVFQTRIMLFRPSRLSCTLSRLRDYVRWVNNEIPRRDAERYTTFVKTTSDLIMHFEGRGADLSAVKMDVTFEQDLVIEPMVVAYLTNEKQIYCMPQNVHCHVHSYGKLCTGNTPENTFWNDPGFAANFNSINPHSFANSDARSARVHREMLKNSYIKTVEVRQEAAWRV